MFCYFKSMSIIFYTIVVYIFVYYLSIMHSWYVFNDWIFCNVENRSIYDYIVVGGGSAGSIIAAKLSNAKKKVLLLEAGGPAPYFSDIPILTPLLQKSKFDWQYITEPQQDACLGLVGQRSVWPVGKILGGTSRLNYMVYVRGHPSDYNNWFPDFYEPITDNGGSLNIETNKWSSVLSDAVIKGVKEMSLPVHNINNSTRIGFMKVQSTMKDGKRWSTDKILKPNTMLTISTNAFVHKVLFDSKRAVGVEFTTLGRQFKVFATKGIIVSAGTIGTPKLLMLSGIGPKEHLEQLNINVIADLPVGKNLVDHIITGLDLVTLKINPPLSIIDVLNPISLFDYLIYGKGPWTFSGVEVIGTLHRSFQGNHSVSPDLEIMVLPGGVSQDTGIILRKAMGIPNKIFEEYFSPLSRTTAVTIAPVLLHPKSSGEVKLQSANPNDNPLIDPNYLSNKDDVLSLIDGIKFIKRLVQTSAMKELGAVIYKKHFPGCEDYVFDSDEYWECYIRHFTLTSYHPAGTCRIGHVTDKLFRVYATENLYAVDASVLPSLPSGNINAAVVMLAEKASRIILQNDVQNVFCKKVTKCHILNIFLQETNKCTT